MNTESQTLLELPQIAAPLFTYIKEREQIRHRKEAGQPAPWTDDPILREYSFTSVRHSDDRTTRRLMTYFYGPNASVSRPGDVLFNCGLARFFGQPDAVGEIGWQKHWNVESVVSRARAWEATERGLWTGAYVVTNGGEKSDKVDYVCK